METSTRVREDEYRGVGRVDRRGSSQPADADGEEHAPPRPVDRFRRTTAGTVVAAGLLGLRDALEGRPEKEEPAVVVNAPAPTAKGPVEVTLDFEHPERSKVVIRRPPDAPDRPTD